VYVDAFLVENTMSAPHVGLVINPPAGGWPLTEDGFFNINISSFTSMGVPVTNPQVIRIPTTLIAPPMTLDSTSTPNGDGTVDGNDDWIFNFSQEPIAFGHAVKNQDGVTVPGGWVKSPGSGTAVFKVQNNWEDHGTSFSFDPSMVRGTSGILLSSPSTVTVLLKRTLTQLAVSPVSGSMLSSTALLSVTFNTPPGAHNMPSVLENGLGMPGSWSGTGNTVLFAPGRNWTPNATVTVSWVTLVDDNGTAVSNPGTQTYQVLDEFLFQDSEPPTDTGRVTTLGQFILVFNRPVDLNTLVQPRINGVPVPGAWSYNVGNPLRAIFTATNPVAPNSEFTLDINGARSTTNVPLGMFVPTLRYSVAPLMTLNFPFPPPGTTLAGSSAFFLDFNMEPDPNTMPVVTYLAPNGILLPKAGTWTRTDFRAFFQPASPWGTSSGIFITVGPNVKSIFGTSVSNQTSYSYVSVP
jgi:hypothetical protein